LGDSYQSSYFIIHYFINTHTFISISVCINLPAVFAGPHSNVAGGAVKSLAESDGKPVDDFDPGDEAEAEEEAEEAANLGDKVDDGYPEGALKLENGWLLGNRLAGIRLLVIENMD